MGAVASKNKSSVGSDIGRFSCNLCHLEIKGVRYAHSDIADYDLCEKCYKLMGTIDTDYYSKELVHPRVILEKIEETKEMDNAFRVAFEGILCFSRIEGNKI